MPNDYDARQDWHDGYKQGAEDVKKAMVKRFDDAYTDIMDSVKLALQNLDMGLGSHLTIDVIESVLHVVEDYVGNHYDEEWESSL